MLYPTVLATSVAAAVLLGDSVLGSSSQSAVPAIWLLLVPMVIEWTLEHAGRVAYSPRRQMAVSFAAGIGGGLALAIHAFDPFNLRATLPVAATAAACLTSVLLSRPAKATSSASASTDLDANWLVRHETEEAERTARLTALLGDAPTTTSRTSD
ncbi:MAG: hypothetical protein WBA45_12905 [Microthrixaceae bacterium]